MIARTSSGVGMSTPTLSLAFRRPIGVVILVVAAVPAQASRDVLRHEAALLGVGEDRAERPEDLAHHIGRAVGAKPVLERAHHRNGRCASFTAPIRGVMWRSRSVWYDSSVVRSSLAASPLSIHSCPALAIVRLWLSAVCVPARTFVGGHGVPRIGFTLAREGLQVACCRSGRHSRRPRLPSFHRHWSSNFVFGLTCSFLLFPAYFQTLRSPHANASVGATLGRTRRLLLSTTIN